MDSMTQYGFHQNNFAKIFILVPSDSNQALILRRGPTTSVGVYSWDLTNDQVIERQWLKGRIYEYLCDISPNGKYFIYSANKKGTGYTVISRAPWIKAISFWRNLGWRGGGIFTSNKKYVLMDTDDHFAKFISKDLIQDRSSWYLCNDGIYHARLVKNGWSLKTRTKSRVTYRKPLSVSVVLEKVVVNSYNFPRFEFHRLVLSDQVEEKIEWHWSDWKDGWLLWAEKGRLYRSQLPENSITLDGKLVYDFNSDKFREKSAPY